MATYYNPVQLCFGPGQLHILPDLLKKAGGSQKLRVLLLTGARSLAAAGHLDTVFGLLDKIPYRHLHSIPSNPDLADILRLKAEVSQEDYNLILTVGGGSVIDSGKILAALQHVQADTAADLRTVIQNGNYLPAGLTVCPLWAVPTTAGTGSEVTSWATVWDREGGRKYSVAHPALYPRLAIVDPQMTLALNRELTAATALDAVSHATEACWSKNSHEIVRLYGLQAIRLLRNNLAAVLDDPLSLPLRTQIAYGSLFAGLAFSNTKTTACHSISYPLTLAFGIPHGVAVCLTLGQLLKKNLPALSCGHELLQAFAAGSPAEVTAWIRDIFSQAGIPVRLSDWGVTAADLPAIAAQSYTPGRMDNNPVDVGEEFIVRLLADIL